MIKNQNHPGLRPCPAKNSAQVLLFGAEFTSSLRQCLWLTGETAGAGNHGGKSHRSAGKWWWINL